MATAKLMLNCPNNEAGICTSKDKVERYDRGVLDACRLSEGTEISYEDFLKKVRELIIATGKREKICGECSWDYICRNKNVTRNL